MNKVNQMIKNKLEKLQSDYGECKIDKNEFIAGITELGFTTPMDIEMLYDEACEGRYQYKLEQNKKLSAEQQMVEDNTLGIGELNNKESND